MQLFSNFSFLSVQEAKMPYCERYGCFFMSLLLIEYLGVTFLEVMLAKLHISSELWVQQRS
jgi:hypothetical protein